MKRLQLGLLLGAALTVGETLAALASGGWELGLLLQQAPIAFALGLAAALVPVPLRWVAMLPLLAVGSFHLMQLVLRGAPRDLTGFGLIGAHLAVSVLVLRWAVKRPREQEQPQGRAVEALALAYLFQALACAWWLYPLVNARWSATPALALLATTLVPCAAAIFVARTRPLASTGLLAALLLVVAALAWPIERAAHTRLPAPGPLAAEGLPDVVLIVLDTTRADRLSLYGHERPTTPRLEQFARTATVYERAVSPAIWTLPGHAALFTGLWSPEHGADWHGGQAPPIPAEALTVAERFRLAGYRTACVSSNLLFSARFGLNQGFELVWSEPAQTAPLLATRVALEVVFRASAAGHAVRKQLGALERGQQAPATDVNEVALRWLEDVGSDAPRFLFVNLMEAHGLLRRCSCGSPTFGEGRAWNEHDVLGRSEALSDLADADPESLARLRDWYDSQLACLDHHVGELLDGLREAGVFDDALVVVTADHGEMLGEQRSFNHKGEVWDGLVHVPLIVKLPGQTAGARCDEPTGTDAVAAALPLLAGLPGVESLPTWAGSADWLPDPVRAALFEPTPAARSVCPLPGRRLDAPASMAVRKPTLVSSFGERWDRGWLALQDGDLKLLQDTRGTRFAVERVDGAERRRELTPAESARFDELLERWRDAQIEVRRADGAAQSLDEENLRALRELGYVGGDD